MSTNLITGENHMAIIKLVCTRNTESANLTFGKGTFNALSVTGEIYDAEGYQALYTNEAGIPEKVDLSASLIKCIATVSFRGNDAIYTTIKEKVTAYFQELADSNIFDIKVGLVIKGKVSAPVKGMHPTLKIPTLTVLINNAELLKIEEPEILEMAENLVESTTNARENAKERNATGLAAYLTSGVKKTASMFSKSLFDNSSSKQAEEFANELEKKKAGRPPKAKTLC
jgi:hypothetical protein